MRCKKNRVTLYDKTFEVMIPAEQIDRAVAQVAEQINADYADREAPLFLGVLNGSFMSFVKLASYVGTSTTGKVQELIGLKNNIEGRHVIVVEDIVDTGESIEHLMRSLSGHNPASVEVATLFFKPNSYSKQIPIKYMALEIGNEFIVGYGLDYDQLGRNLKDVYVVVNE